MQIKPCIVQKSFSLPVHRYEQWNRGQERETWNNLQIFQPLIPSIHIPGSSPQPCHAEGVTRLENLPCAMGGKTPIICLAPFICSYYCKLPFFFFSRQWLCYYRYLHAVPKHIHTAIQNNQPCFHGSKGCSQMKWVEITLNNLGIC